MSGLWVSFDAVSSGVTKLGRLAHHGGSSHMTGGISGVVLPPVVNSVSTVV